jgi:integral membrane protein (TIGR01906 family)
MPETSPLHTLLGWLIALLVPFAVILTGIRILLTPAWVNIEYRMPKFPDDPYGFTRADRLQWAIVSLDYLLNQAGIDFFDDKVFADGTPIYNERELGHLADVKNVVRASLRVWAASLGIVILSGVWAKYGGWVEIYKQGIARGSWITIGLVSAVLLLVVVAFGVFFVYFHNVFFDPGTWTFAFSDTLIRLFPQRFWQDAFLWIGGLSILQALWLLSLTRAQ